jgi:hypothetical protein
MSKHPSQRSFPSLRKTQRTRKTPLRRPLIELLEERVVPATTYLSGAETTAHPVIPVALQQAATSKVTVSYAVAGGTATSKDFTLPAGKLTFNAGDTVKDIPLTILDDNLAESNETIVIKLSASKGALLGPNTQLVYTILEDHTLPTVSFSSATGSGDESKGGSFTVSLSAPSAVPVTVQYAATGGTASGGGVDYTLKAGALTFKPGGPTSQSVKFSVVNDKLFEANETVGVSLFAPTNATIGATNVFTYSIQDNDPAPTVAFVKATGSGSETANLPSIPVSLSAIAGQTITVPYSVTGGTAQSGVNYVLASGTLTFPAGAKTENIPLQVIDAGALSSSPTVQITLSALGNVPLGTNSTFTYTILPPATVPTVAFQTTTGSGAETTKLASLPVVLSGPASKPVTVQYALTGGTAVAGVDYTNKPGVLTIKAGKTSGTITIPIIANHLNEPNTTIVVTLSDPSGAFLGANASFTYTIVDTDPTPTVGFTMISGTGQELVSGFAVPVSLSGASSLPITINYAIGGGTADGVTNYVPSAGTLTFAPGSKNGVIPLTILDGSPLSSSKTVQVTLSSPTNATLGGKQIFTYTILPTPGQVGFDSNLPSVLSSSLTTSTTTGNLHATGRVGDDFSGVASLLVALDDGAPTTVSVDASGFWGADLPLGQSIGGGHTLHLILTDRAGNKLDTTEPVPIFDLSPGSDTGTIGDHSTTYGKVTLTGTAPAGATVRLVGTSMQTMANNSGAFQLPNVPLTVGSNTITLQATDTSGNVATFTLTITRTSVTNPPPDAVIVWNQATLSAIQSDGTDPQFASRGLAMVQAAVFDAVNSIDGTQSYYVHVNAPAGASADAAVDQAAHDVLVYLYPTQQATFDSLLISQLALLTSGQSVTDGRSVGQTVASAIVAMRVNDGSRNFVDYVPGSNPGDWQPTAPAFAPALDPQFATVTPFALTSPDQFRPAGPAAITSQAFADAVNQTESLGQVNSTTRTADQTQIAQFWNDATGTYTPPGHWNAIAETVAQALGDSLADDARLFAELNISMADAGITAWNTKYNYNFWRPITVIQGGADGVNPNITENPTWYPLLTTPNFPEYVSGHSTFSAAAATVLDSVFGSNVSFTTSEPTTTLTRNYTSFDQAALDAGMSRIYAGIHYTFSNTDGHNAGVSVANYVLGTFALTTDTTPPRVTLDNASGKSSKTNVTITGQVTDNFSGVAKLEVQVDTGSFAALAFDPATGRFSFTTTLATDGSADGAHTISFRGTDAATNVETPVAFTFTLASKAPTVTVNSPADNGTLHDGDVLSGTVQTSGGSSLVALNYAFDGGMTMPLAFGTDGSFSQRLNLSKLLAGAHTLVVSATDGAGNTTTQTLHLTLNAAISLQVANLTPANGTSDVSVTFRPTVTFTRAIDKTTLNGNNFYATDSTGAKIAAAIVPADDGTSAQLFFTNALPSAATITLVVDGSTIKDSSGTLLDAADNGTPGSKSTTTFITVSSTLVPGTTLSGIVADPGPDNQAMTRDDVRNGADGVLGTADDVYLNPIAGAKVYVIGHEDQAVISDASGKFSFSAMPVGDVKLIVDGRTATNAPSGVFYPEMVFDLNIQAGAANTVMGSMGSTAEQLAMATSKGVYLPRLQSSILKPAGGSTSTTITLDPTASQFLTPQQASQYSITVAPNSLVGADGSKMSSGMVGFSTVSPALIRDMLPQGVMQLATTLTIQAPGVAAFSTPLQLTFANVYGAAPGSKLDVYSFNHTTGMLEITGTATVSADGKTVTTDPDSGVTHPGWFGVTPPGDCGGDDGQPPMPMQTPPTPLKPQALPLVVGNTGSFPTQTFTENEMPPMPPPPPPPGCPPQPAPNTPYLEVKIDVDGLLSYFMKQTGDESLTTNSFNVYYGAPKTFSADPASYTDMFSLGGLFGSGLTSITSNYLFGSKVTITQTYHHADGSSDGTTQDFYLYRLIDATDDNSEDGTLKFEDSLTNSVTRTKPLVVVAGDKSMPTVALDPGSTNANDFSVDQAGNYVTLKFKPVDNLVGPSATPGDDMAQFTITTPDPKAGQVPTKVKLEGKSYAPMNLFVGRQAIIDSLLAYSTATAAQAGPIADQIIVQATADVAGFAGITVNGGNIGNTVSVDFMTRGPALTVNPDGSKSGTVGRDPVIDNVAKLTALLNSKGNYNTAQQNYLLAEALNQITSPKTVNVFVNNFIGLGFGADIAQLENAIGNTIAHEFGHGVGLVHTGSIPQGKPPLTNGMVNGAGDLMYQGTTTGNRSFLAGLTAEALDMALKMTWTSDQAQTALSYYAQNLTAGGAGFFQTQGIITDDETPPSPLLTGPHLLVLSAQTGNLVNAGFDFGSVPVDTSATSPTKTTFTLANAGSQDVLLSSVSLTSATTPFSVSGVPAGTVLHPGDSVQLQVAFDPTTAGSFSADLHVVSNDPTVLSDIVLTGFGQSATPSAALTLGNNDLGGVAVGSSVQSANVATITNQGAQPLVISTIAVEAGGSSFTLTGVPTNLASNPITLGAGQTFSFGVQYTASTVGLERAKIDVGSNDPGHPTLSFGVTGTGLGSVVYPHWGKDYVAIEFPDLAATATLRAVSDASGHFSFFLPANQHYHIAIFDPVTGLIANGYGVTPNSGVGIGLTSGLVFGPSTAPDTDGDGLPNDVEFAVGTNPNSAFTAGDGIDDFTHIIVDHTSAIGGKPLATGVVAVAGLNGSAEDLTLAGSTSSSAAQTAYVATGSYGLAVVDASNPLKPVVLGQIQLQGNSTGVAVDSQLGIAAVASGNVLNLVDVSDPAHPKLLQAVNVGADSVKALDGIAYAASGSLITAIDMKTGSMLDQESFPAGTVDDMSIADGNLYLVAHSGIEPHTVYKVPLDGSSLQEPSYSITINGHPTFGRLRIFAGSGNVYVGAADNNDNQQIPGVEVIQDTGTALNLVGPSSAITAFAVAVNSSGLALYCGGLQLSDEVDLLDLSNPTSTGTVVTRFPTSGNANNVAIAGGYGFVADGSGGLAVINFLPFDTKGVPPSVSISLPSSSVVGTNGNVQKVLEASQLPILTTATDDVQVRNVELLVNGQVAENAVSYPFELSQLLPTLAQYGSGTTTFQVRATDTGGNVGLSNVITIQLVKDTVPPVLTSVNVPDGGKESQFFHTLVFNFSKPLDPSTVTASTFALTGPSGTVAPTSITLLKHNQSVTITYPSLATGAYQVVLDQAHIADRLGNVGSGTFTRNFTIQTYSAVWVNPNGGDASDPTNWQGGVLPKATDDVLIDVPNGVTITFSTGTLQVHSLLATDPLTLSGGKLIVATTLEADGGLTFSGGTLTGAELKTSGSLTVSSYANFTLDGVKLDNDLTVVQNASLTLAHGLTLAANLTVEGGGPTYYGDLTFEGNQTLAGSGKVFLGTKAAATVHLGTNMDGSAATLTIGSGITVQGQGTISPVYSSLSGPATVVNQGTISVTTASQSLSIGANFNNTGTVQLGDKDTLVLGGVETLADVQSVATTGSAAIQIAAFNGVSGAALNNAGKTLALDGLPGYLSFGPGGGIIGGTVTSGAPFALPSGWDLDLDGVTNKANITIGTGTTLRLDGAWVQQGTLNLTAGTLDIGGDFHLADLGNYTRSGGAVNLTGILENDGSTFTLNSTTGSWNLAGGEIRGGTVTTPGSAQLTLLGTPGSPFLYPDGTLANGVTLQTNLTVSQGASLDISGGLTLVGTMTDEGGSQQGGSLNFLGTQTLAGTGQVVLGTKAPAVIHVFGNFDGSEGVFTVASGITITGQGVIETYFGSSGGSKIVNQGIIAVTVSGETLGILDDLSNTSQIQVADNTTLTLGGTLTLADLAHVFVTGTGKVVLTGTIDNTGGTLDLNALPAYLQIAGGRILGGTVQTTTGSYTLASGESLVLDGVTLTGHVIVPTGTTLSMAGAWSNTGTLDVTGGTLNLGGTFTHAALGTLNHSSGTINLKGVLDLVNTTLSFDSTTGSWNLSGGTIKNGTYSASGSAALVFTANGGTLDNLIANSDLNLNTGYYSTVDVKDGLTLNNTILRIGDAAGNGYAYVNFDNTETLNGTNGFVLFGGSYNNALYTNSASAAMTLTIGAGVTVHGTYGTLGENYTTGTIVNQGTIAADGTGTHSGITVNATNFTNQHVMTAVTNQTLTIDGVWSNAAGGTITATGATLDLGDQYDSSTNAWSNAGTITATNSTVNLGGVFTLAAAGTFNRTGGTVNIVGTLNNTGSTFTLNAATGSWNLSGGTVKGGTYVASGGAGLVFTSNGGTLDGLTAASDLFLNVNSYAIVHVVNNLTLANNAIVHLGNVTGSISGSMYFDNDETLGGTGTVLLGASYSNTLYVGYAGNATLTIGTGVTIRGGSGSIGNYYYSSANQGTIINNGTIAADGSVAPGDFAYDRDFSANSYAEGNSATIDTSAANAAPAYVYQSYRYSSDSAGLVYTLGGLTPGSSYTVRLHFAELYYTSAGGNTFDVFLNTTKVLSAFDIYAAAGAKDKAVVEEFTATADGSGAITAKFVGIGYSYGEVNGIEVLSGTTQVLAINAGDTPYYGITINPNTYASSTTFTNQKTVSASNGETLTIAGVWTNAAGGTISATGATLDLGDQSDSSTNAWSNVGTITATNSTVNLGGVFTLAAAGSFSRTGGTVNIVGTLNNTGNTLTLTGTTGSWDLAGGTIKGGTYVSAGGALVFTTSGGTLDGLTANSDLNLNTGYSSTVSVKDGLTLNNVTLRLGDAPGNSYGYVYFVNTETLDGTNGTVLFGGNSNNTLDTNSSSAVTLTIGSGITVRGAAGTLGSFYSTGAIVNNGTILADGSVGAGDFAFDRGYTGTSSTTGTSDAIDTSAANAAPQYVYQSVRYGSAFGYTLSGLTPNASYTVRLHFAETYFSSANQRVFNVSVNGTPVAALQGLDVFAAAGGMDKALVKDVNSVTADASGNITVSFTATTDNAIVNGIEVLSGTTGVLTVNAGDTLYYGLTISPATFTNQKTISASNTDTLTIGGAWTNAAVATITATGTTLGLGDQYQYGTLNPWSNAGTITATNSTVNLGGTFTTADLGTFNHPGSTIDITGTLDNTGKTLTLDGTTGSWNLSGGTIKGGSYVSAGAALVFTSNGGTLDGLTANSDLDLGTNYGAYVIVKDGLTLNGTTLRLGNVTGSTYGYVYFDGDQTLTGTGATVLFGGNSSNEVHVGYSASATLTIDTGVTLRGGSGYVGNYYTSTVVNKGTIAADGSVGAGDFAYDHGFANSDGTYSVSDAIDTSAANAAPAYVYQSYRYSYNASGLVYTLSSLTPNTAYKVRLHFAEIYYNSAGNNGFDVFLNGTKVLSGFDIYAAAGAKDKAVVEEFTATADSSGVITATFVGVSGQKYGQVNGIEVLSGTTQVLTLNAGLTNYYGITVNPTAFTNQGTLLAGNGDSLSVSGLADKVGNVTLTGSGSKLMLDGDGYSIDKGLTATVGQTVTLSGTWTNLAGSTISATGATLSLGEQSGTTTKAWTNSGTITASSSTVNLGGAFTLASLGTFNRSGGTINLTGALDDTGTTLALNGTTGSWDLSGGTIKAGSYSASGGASLVFTNNGGTLDGLTANSDLDLGTNYGAYVIVKDGLTLNGTTLRLGNVTGSTYGYVYFDGDQTLTGTGATVLFGGNSNNEMYVGYSASATLTIDTGVTLRGGSGSLSDYYTSTVVNKGTIAADGSVGAGDFAFDRGFSNSDGTYSVSDAIDTSATNAAPAYVYQSYRYSYNASGLVYTLSSLTPNTAYEVRLHFAETYYTSAGNNAFDVFLNGTKVLSGFDIYAAAGAKDKAVVEEFTATADSSGVITATFVGVSGQKYGQVNGIEVLSGTTQVLTLNAGLTNYYGITVNPSTLTNTNQGTLLAANGDSLSLSNLQANGGTITANAGGTVKVSGDYTQTASGTMSVQVGGTASGQYGTVSVSGNATLAGTLNVAAVNGYAPNVGDTLPGVLSYGSQTGSFGTINASGLPAHEALTPTYDATGLTLTVGAAQRASSANGPATGTASALTQGQLAPIVAAAISRWAGDGIGAANVALLRHAKVQIADLGGAFLGLEGNDTILVDRTADGYGWFVDPTPFTDTEFAKTSDPQERVAGASSPAHGRMDLLTVVMHEFGHLLGLADKANGVGPDTLMTEDLAAGVRRLPDSAERYAVIGHVLAVKDGVFGSLGAGTASFVQTGHGAWMAELAGVLAKKRKETDV